MSDSINNLHENEPVAPEFDDQDNLNELLEEVSAPAEPEIPLAAASVSDDATVKLSQKELKALRKEQKRAEKKAKEEAEQAAAQEETEDEREYSPIRRNRDSKRGILSGVMYAVFIIATSVVLAVVGWMVASDVFAFNAGDFVTVVTIEETDSLGDVSKKLKEAELINYSLLFRFYAGISHADEKIDPGTYELGSNLDYRALVNRMQQGILVSTVQVTIPEGYTMNSIFTLLDEKGVCDYDKLYEAAANYNFSYSFLSEETGDATRMEGYLFPDTYEFYVGEQAASVINKFLANFSNKFDKELLQIAEANNRSMEEIIIIASLIEREAANDEERPNIASVIYNRLNSSYNYLELDSTVFYGAGLLEKDFDTELDSPYNTYKYPGLPIKPICNPGMSSINAALKPASTNYMYFAYGVDGVSHFFVSYNDFINFVNSDQYASELS